MNTENGFTEYRYFKSKHHNVPKLAFKFDVNYSQDKDVPTVLKFSYAICNEHDNFCRATARKLLDERMENNNILVGAYRGNDISLVDTAMKIVDDTLDVVERDNVQKVIKTDKNAIRNFNNIKKLRESHDWIMKIKNIDQMLENSIAEWRETI